MAGCHAGYDAVRSWTAARRQIAQLPSAASLDDRLPGDASVDGGGGKDLLPVSLLDRATARAIAVAANPDMRVALARLQAARARVDEVAAQFYPAIIAKHDSVRTFHTPASRNRLSVPTQPVSSVPSDSDTFNASEVAITTILNAIRRPLFGRTTSGGSANSYSEHSTSVTVSWTLYDGFLREAQTAAATHAFHASEAAMRDARRLIISAVDAAYLRVQLAEEQVRIAEADRVFSEDQLQVTRKLEAEGRASHAEVGNFRVRALAATSRVTSAIGLRASSRTVLAELMGIDDVALPDELAVAALEDETADEMAPPDPMRWLSLAMEQRPDLAQLRCLLDVERANVRAASSQFHPVAVVSGSWGFDKSSNVRYTVQDQSSAAGLELQWELYSGGSRQARLRQARSAQAEAAAMLQRHRLAVQADVRQAMIDITNAQQQIRLQRENLATARENRRVIQAAYAAGKETLTRLNEAQRDYINADADLALARIQLRQAWSDLSAAAATTENRVGR